MLNAQKTPIYNPGVPIHIVQRGHSKEPVLFEDNDYQAYLDWLAEAATRYACEIHAYGLMNNHIHLLITPSDKTSITRMMQYIGRYYVPILIRPTVPVVLYGKGATNLIDSEQYLLTCMRYIELNPVRAKMVRTPAQYRWSSYRHNGQGKDDGLITPHDLYSSLRKSKLSRITAYKALFQSQIDKGILKVIRTAWQTGTPLGNDYFKEKIEKKLKCKVGQARQGRPNKSDPTDSWASEFSDLFKYLITTLHQYIPSVSLGNGLSKKKLGVTNK
ncbi:MAG: transposase [Thiohalomonadales bacterium]